MIGRAKLVLALGIVVFVIIGIAPPATHLVPTVPKVHAASVSIVLVGFATTGWNGSTNPNPTITVTQGDTVTITLSSGDTIIHRFLLDIDHDGVADTGDCTSVDPCSSAFPPSTSITFTATTQGTFTYYCTLHPTTMLGGFVVNPSSIVGGTVFPVDKLGLLAPYIGFASIAAVIVLGAVYVMRIRNPKGERFSGWIASSNPYTFRLGLHQMIGNDRHR